MKVTFWKVEAAGNDFIIIDYRMPFLKEQPAELARRLTHRRLGIGADGLILIERSPGVDFFMNFYNADGSGPVMCGNGARAALFFVCASGMICREEYCFKASDGVHRGEIKNNRVALTINQPGRIEPVQLGAETAYLVDTGVPHLVRFCNDVDSLDITEEAPDLRKRYNANINYIEKTGDGGWKIRTWERGVEGETLACGTGATASAVTIHKICGESFPVTLWARGGELIIHQKENELWLTGPVRKVFDGTFTLNE
ncbi:MAG: diaminopimelate epimerase [Fidelibacterota bacterium]